jgi:nucleotide-binding universal stress UspA family protein
MTGAKPIVVAVDGSEAASNAVVWAAREASVSGRPLRIVTITHIPAFYYSEPYLADSFKQEADATAQARLDSAEVLARSSVDDDLSITTEAREGKVAQALIDMSADAYTIAVGPRGHGEFTGLIVGSVTAALAPHAQCPVAVVRGRTIDGEPPNVGPIVVGVDGSEHSEPALSVAFAEADARNAPLVAVNVWSDVSVQPSLGNTPDDKRWAEIQAGEEAVLSERLAGYIERYPDVPVERVVARDRPVRVLSEYAEAAQLIVVGSRGRGGFTGMAFGSVSNALLHTADCPVVIVRPECGVR